MSYLIRPAKLSDLFAVLDLARQAGPGFTSLQPDEGAIAARLQKVEASFQAPEDTARAKLAYLMALEDDKGKVIGISGVKPAVGIERPFYNFRVAATGQVSFSAKRRFDMNMLWLVSECDGFSEVGSLLLDKDRRGGGVGRMLAQARYMLIAAGRRRFADYTIAELRGWFEADGTSPFWDAVGAHFFRMSFDEADALSGATDGQFLADLLPRHPICMDLLPQSARDVVGKCHKDGEAAMRLLEWEGFRYPKLIDVFDGGPLVLAPTDSIRTLRDSRVLPIEIRDGLDGPTALVSNDKFEHFRLTRATAVVNPDHVVVAPKTAGVLQVRSGETVRVWAPQHD